MPDLHYPHWTLIAEGDLVVIHMPAEGTFTNELMGIPPNGKKMFVWMANVWRFADGKIVESAALHGHPRGHAAARRDSSDGIGGEQP